MHLGFYWRVDCYQLSAVTQETAIQWEGQNKCLGQAVASSSHIIRLKVPQKALRAQTIFKLYKIQWLQIPYFSAKMKEFTHCSLY